MRDTIAGLRASLERSDEARSFLAAQLKLRNDEMAELRTEMNVARATIDAFKSNAHQDTHIVGRKFLIEKATAAEEIAKLANERAQKAEERLALLSDRAFMTFCNLSAQIETLSSEHNQLVADLTEENEAKLNIAGLLEYAARLLDQAALVMVGKEWLHSFESFLAALKELDHEECEETE